MDQKAGIDYYSLQYNNHQIKEGEPFYWKTEANQFLGLNILVYNTLSGICLFAPFENRFIQKHTI